jgi:hypothetical protein
VQRRGWAVATGVLVAVGLGLRLAIGHAGAGDRSAAVMLGLLAVLVWVAALLVSTPRTAFFVTLGTVVVLNFAALPARNPPEYDDREAFFRSDQLITATTLPVPRGLSRPVLSILAEPVFAGAQPAFDLVGEVQGSALAWNCAFQHGMQRLALPVPPGHLDGRAAVEVRLHLDGSPRRESDYLLVYASSLRGGLLVSIVDAAELGQNATLCSLR